MDCYEIWVDLAPNTTDLEFVQAVSSYLDYFSSRGMVRGYRIRRRKFGFGPGELGEFCITIEFDRLADMDEVFQVAATRGTEIEPLHAAVYSKVRNFRSALYRDFPDPVRQAPD